MMNVISVCNLKGGVGKTITSIQLGAALAERGLRVLLLDVDLQHGLTSYFSLDPRGVTLDRVLLDGAPLCDGIQNVRERLDAVPSSARMEVADKELPHQPGGDLRLRLALNNLSGYDFVFIDCPSGWGATARNALLASTHLLLPINCEPAALRSAFETYRKGLELAGYFNHEFKLAGVLLTCFRATTIARTVEKGTRQYWPQDTLQATVRRAERVNELSAYGETLFDDSSARNAGLRDDYAAVASEVIARCCPTKKVKVKAS